MFIVCISVRYIIQDESKVHLELKINAFELNFLSEIVQNNNNLIEKNEFDEKKRAIKKRLLESLKIEINGFSAVSTIKWRISLPNPCRVR